MIQWKMDDRRLQIRKRKRTDRIKVSRSEKKRAGRIKVSRSERKGLTGPRSSDQEESKK